MPELPEVETIARGLRASIVGKKIEDVRCRCPCIVKTSFPSFRRHLKAKAIDKVLRYGKYLFLVLSGGSGIALHLRMTGQIFLVPREREMDRHTHLEFLLQGSANKLVYRDVRKFGRFELLGCDPAEFIRYKKLGPDALAVDAEQTHTRLSLTRRALKAALLDQSMLAGLGNIYADEILYRERISPLRSASELTRKQAASLAASIHALLSEAIEKNGTTISDFVNSLGEQGGFQGALRVYGKEGEPCPSCGTRIAKRRVAGRGTYFCPRCQRR